MSKIKKLIALTLALAMVLSVSAFAGYKVDTYVDAADINDDCKGAVELLYALGIMTGDANNQFRPTATITRAEVAKMIYVILNYGNDDNAVNYKGGSFFSDVEAGAWYEGYVNYMASTKLVQGRGDGTFGPNATITTAEVAKMLLTAIGYSAADRGYTGAAWAENVLADAAYIGLLQGYNTNVNTTAPRQWVAVMFENALLNALTYETIRPTINGLLTNTSTTLIDAQYPTMGLKYYGLDSFTKVAYATEDAYINQITNYTLNCDCEEGETHVAGCWNPSTTAGEGKVLFENGLSIKKTGLKASDLGQKYKVIYNVKDMTAYSVRSLGATAESRIYDMDVEVKYATDKNQPNNKYVFTVGDMKAAFNSATIKYLSSDVRAQDPVNGTVNAEAVYEAIEKVFDDAEYEATIVKAIDSENDGDIDYLYITDYIYGYVTKVATSNKYGKYINVAKAGTEEDPEYVIFSEVEGTEDENLYLKDTVITADEIEEEEIVKISYDIETGKYVIEVLPMANGVEYEEYDDKNDIFVLGGKEYYIAVDPVNGDDWKSTCDEFLVDTDDYLGENLNIVYDGDLIVWVGEDDDSYDSMDKVNEQLVLLIDANFEYSNNTIREYKAIEYMTIDGKTHIAKYDVDEMVEDDTTAVDFADLQTTADRGTVEDRLFKLKSGTKGRVYLERLDDEKINDQLSVKKSVLDGYEYDDDYCVDATGSTIKVMTNYVPAQGEDDEAEYDDVYKVDADNKYFVGTYNDDDEFEATVMTLDELKHCIDESAYAQILTETNEKGTRTTVVGGYLFLELKSDKASDYLYIEKIGNITKDGRKVNVVFSNGEKKAITVDEDNEDCDELVKNVLYTYVYDFMEDNYVLTMIEIPEDQIDEIVDFDDDNYVWVENDEEVKDYFELEDEVIAIVTIEVDRDETQIDEDNEDDVPAFELKNKGIEFVALKDLKIDMIENDEDDNTYTQYTDYLFVSEDLFYVVNFQVQNTAQEFIQDNLETDDALVKIFEAILAGKKEIAANEVE